MRIRTLARKLLDGYRRAFASNEPFFPAWEKEVGQAIAEDEQQAKRDAERLAAFEQYRRAHPVDAPSEQTKVMQAKPAGVQRVVSGFDLVRPAATVEREASAARRSVEAASR